MSSLQDLRGVDPYSSIVPSGRPLELDKQPGASLGRQQGKMEGRGNSSPTPIPSLRPQRSSYLLMRKQI